MAIKLGFIKFLGAKDTQLFTCRDCYSPSTLYDGATVVIIVPIEGRGSCSSTKGGRESIQLEMEGF